MIEIPTWAAVAMTGAVLAWGGFVTRLAFSNKGERGVSDEKITSIADRESRIEQALEQLVQAQIEAAVAAKEVAVTVEHLGEKVGAGFNINTEEHREIDAKIDLNIRGVATQYIDHEHRLSALEAQIARTARGHRRAAAGSVG